MAKLPAVLSTRVETSTQPFDAQVAIDDIEESFNAANAAIYKDIAPEILKDFGKASNPNTNSRKRPFVWSFNEKKNRRAQKWWFWAVNNDVVPTQGKRYARTGRINKMWRIRPLDRGGIRGFALFTDARDKQNRFAYRWVIGTFSKRRGKRRVPSHNIWYFAQDKAQFWENAYIERLEKQYPEFFARIRNR